MDKMDFLSCSLMLLLLVCFHVTNGVFRPHMFLLLCGGVICSIVFVASDELKQFICLVLTFILDTVSSGVFSSTILRIHTSVSQPIIVFCFFFMSCGILNVFHSFRTHKLIHLLSLIDTHTRSRDPGWSGGGCLQLRVLLRGLPHGDVLRPGSGHRRPAAGGPGRTSEGPWGEGQAPIGIFVLCPTFRWLCCLLLVFCCCSLSPKQSMRGIVGPFRLTATSRGCHVPARVAAAGSVLNTVGCLVGVFLLLRSSPVLPLLLDLRHSRFAMAR